MYKKLLLIAVFLGLISAGCAKKQVVRRDEMIVPAPVAETVSKEEPSVRFSDWTQTSDISVIYFDYDKADLSEEARNLLQKNAEYLKSNSALSIIVEGHCDERGTIEYNLSLGQRRAAIVRDYYGRLGVAVSRIATISYGEEKPEDPNHTESSWAKNRRGVTKVRTASK